LYWLQFAVDWQTTWPQFQALNEHLTVKVQRWPGANGGQGVFTTLQP